MSSSAPAKTRCATPGCQAKANGKWCEDHQRVYDRIKAEIAAGRGDRLRSRKRAPYKRKARCTSLDCTSWAKPGQKLCLYHLRMRGME